MPLRFPLSDVIVRRVEKTRTVDHPAYADELWQMNQEEFAMQVEGVGNFYACNGKEVEYAPAEGVVPEMTALYLNGSVYGAILHQRQILPLHGSSFIENRKGVLICGDSGVGKSSLAAAFSLKGSMFLTDDVTPVIIADDKPGIMALSDHMKLCDNTLDELNLDRQGLRVADNEYGKFYYPMGKGSEGIFPLDFIFILEIADLPETVVEEITGAEKVIKVRNEIYRSEYLKGMKENEAVYFRVITGICRDVRVMMVRRPSGVRINRLKAEIAAIINCA